MFPKHVRFQFRLFGNDFLSFPGMDCYGEQQSNIQKAPPRTYLSRLSLAFGPRGVFLRCNIEQQTYRMFQKHVIFQFRLSGNDFLSRPGAYLGRTNSNPINRKLHQDKICRNVALNLVSVERLDVKDTKQIKIHLYDTHATFHPTKNDR